MIEENFKFLTLTFPTLKYYGYIQVPIYAFTYVKNKENFKLTVQRKTYILRELDHYTHFV